MIPIARPDLGDAEIAAVTEVLRSGMVAQGARVRELETRWAEECGVRHTIAMSNGTTALMSIFTGLGLGPGDEVVTVAHTFAASANAVLFTGATPVFVDIDPATYTMDPAAAEAAITPRTRAIMPVHLFGLVADMDAIAAIAKRHDLALVEDACQAHGATYRDRVAGSFGTSAFSLYATKNMTTGEGGLITTDDDRLADWLRLYRNQGMRTRYAFEMLGFNFRMSDVSAAIGLVQLDKLERATARRQAIAATYDAAFADLPVRTPVVPRGQTHVYHQYTLHVGPERDAILADLREAGVGADVYYPLPVHRQAYILERGLGAELPHTDRAAAETLALPVYPTLLETEIDAVIAAVRAAVARHAASAATAPAG
ncbi:MAG TPA: DegT/DnrJ/EryC1/StrS family aminotransferase [Candidatus Polarisedimenticolia bacterium]|nr:DegT/DnrJ/EryC1/StrS family aminotransferase [Candidatus Polarisedimenticolia bacterium]